MNPIAFEKTTLYNDVKGIINSASNETKTERRAVLHTVDNDIPIIKVISIDRFRDFVNNFCDYIYVQLLVTKGDYIYRLFPNRDNMEVSIKTIILEDASGSRKKNSTIKVDRYKAVFLPLENPNFNGSTDQTFDKETLDSHEPVTVSFQLLDLSVEPLLVKTVSGVFHKSTVARLIASILPGESDKIKVNGKPSIDGFNMVEPDNKVVREHFSIPPTTRVVDLPTYIQEKAGGIYATGLGTYITKYEDKYHWFVYPLFDTTRFNTANKKAIFYAVPENRYPNINSTFKVDSSILSVVVTGQRAYQDNAGNDQVSHGVGFKLTDANAMLKKPVDITEDGPVAKRANLNNEVAIKARKDGLSHAPTSTTISANPFKEWSKLAARNVAKITLNWENADPSLLHPGMPCQYVFLNKNVPVHLNGVVVCVHDYVGLQGNGLTSNVYKSTCSVVILADSYDEKLDASGPMLKSRF